MRVADASRATAHFRATSEFIACESRPYYAELIHDPQMPEDLIQTFFSEGLAKDDKTGLKKYGPHATVLAKRVRDETAKTKMSKLKSGGDDSNTRLFDARRTMSK